jgi:hypothetical protein
MTNFLTKSTHKQMSHILVLFVSPKFVANQIGLLQTQQKQLCERLSSSLLQKCDGGNAPLVTEAEVRCLLNMNYTQVPERRIKVSNKHYDKSLELNKARYVSSGSSCGAQSVIAHRQIWLASTTLDIFLSFAR